MNGIVPTSTNTHAAQRRPLHEYAVVDIFCGVGGLTHGFILENFHVAAGLDSDPSCQYAYEHNNGAPFIERKIEEREPGEIEALFPQGMCKILVGCAPCQPYSRYTKKGASDEKWRLLDVFADVIEEVDPDIVSMENVPELQDFQQGQVYRHFIDRLSTRFTISEYEVYCPNYGIPQQRSRLVVFGSKYGRVELQAPTHQPDNYTTVQQAIGHLAPIGAGEISAEDPLHRASRLSEINRARIQQSRPGGTWRDWDIDLVAACHRRETGHSYPSVYGRMVWNEPSPTITTQFYGFGNGRFGHPEQNRAISLREGALLQTFPEQYQFVEPGQPCYIKVIGRQIGNAVPVELGRVIARSIAQHIED